MAIKQDKAKAEFIFSCDYCEATIRVPGKEFRDAWPKAKARGWRAFKDDRTGEWRHKCGDWQTHKANPPKPQDEDDEIPF